MAKKPIFKTDFGGAPRDVDPESLFRDLRGRSPDIKHLWSHQADLLRSYYKGFLTARDVAIELPTGSGKTLVGLLIAEFRRQSANERVAYLCPTRQLARQVGNQASKYGIKAHVFVGRQRDYPPAEFGEFQSSKAIAITTYSSVFNSYPRISDAQALILDDAHASENYISSMWSLEVCRSEDAGLHRAIADLFREALSPSFYAELVNDAIGNWRRGELVELVPGRYVREYATGLSDLLDGSLKEGVPAWYAWRLIREHLSACGVFVSWDSILIRPFIPPALTHDAFTRANQRVYMSATLGAGGELERITGVRGIQRIPVPSGWDKRGSGRRLFLIPQISLPDKESMGVVMDAATDLERCLVLTPNQYEATVFINELRSKGLTILGAKDIEDSLEPFSSRTETALVLSRYDGLDLPDDTCRMLVVGGLPSGTNLQEKFLWSRVAAFSLLRDRVLTRFTQGVGRCTRSDNDYAVVFVWGHPLVDFILKHENRRILNSELQAELQFGIENCKANDAEGLRALRDAFLEQDEDWEEAEQAIVSLRETSKRQTDPVSVRLCLAVSDEVDYLYSMWRGDYESALEHARKVADALGGDETKGYRGWWYYLAADAALALHTVDGQDAVLDTAKDLLRRASGCCPAISWFARLARSVARGTGEREVEETTAVAVEGTRDTLADWGAVGQRFEQEVAQAEADLRATSHKEFHRGLRTLGKMLGFYSVTPTSTGAPDCCWSIEDMLHIVHEAKSDQEPGDPIGVNDVRQAQSHEDWAREELACNDATRIVPVIETPRNTVSQEAVVHAKSLCHVPPEQVLDLCARITAVLRRVRAKLTDLSDEKVLEELYREIGAAKLTPLDIAAEFSTQPVRTMPTSE